MRRSAVSIRLLLCTLTAAFVWVCAPAVAEMVAQTPANSQAADAPAGWFCPMHPDVTSNAPGNCRKCNMALVAGNPFDTREYGFDVMTSPAAIRAAAPFTMRLRVRRPESAEVVTKFETVHEKQFHLFLVSHDMEAFQHIHPQMDDSGEWVIEAEVPKPGHYRVLGDFLPTGGGPQFLGRTVTTVDYTGDLEADTAELVPDTELTKRVDDIVARVTLEPVKLIAGEYGHLDYTLSDAQTGQPVTDLQRYLGSYGHSLILSEDLADVVHAHPTEWYDSKGAKIDSSGPHVRFEGYMPRPGLYRVWSQFQRNGRISTVSFTFRVYSLYEAYEPQ